MKSILLLLLFTVLMVCTINFNANAGPCENCATAYVVSSNMQVNNYRYNLANITPFFGQDATTYIGGDQYSFSQGLNAMEAIIGLFSALTSSPNWGPSLPGWGFGQASLVNQMLGASGTYWSQWQQLHIQFQYDGAVLDNQFCACLNQRGCANGCPNW